MTLVLIGICEALFCNPQSSQRLWWWKNQRLCRGCWRAQLGARDEAA